MRGWVDAPLMTRATTTGLVVLAAGIGTMAVVPLNQPARPVTELASSPQSPSATTPASQDPRLAPVVHTQAAPAVLAPPRDVSVPIFMYHVLADPPDGAPFPGLFVRPADFRQHVAWLAKHGYQGVTLTDVWEHWHGGDALPPKPIVLSFDDGYTSIASVALPALRRIGWPGVLNLKVGNLADAIRPRDVRALVAAGWELGAHTITHPDLTSLDNEALETEVAGSRRAIEARFGVLVRFFCYPSGRYDEHVVAAVRAAGFLGATTTEPGFARPTEPFALDRIRVSRGDTDADIGALLRAQPA